MLLILCDQQNYLAVDNNAVSSPPLVHVPAYALVMEFNQRDRVALRVALEKLSASAAAMAEASQDINALVSRMDSLPQAEPARTTPPAQAAVVSSGPPTAQPVLPKEIPSITGGTVELPETWAIPVAQPTPVRAEDAFKPAPALNPIPAPSVRCHQPSQR